MSDTYISFRYRSTKTGKSKTCTLSAEEFIRRFLQHVLPKGFVKVRYYGFFSPTLQARLAQVRAQLDSQQPDIHTTDNHSQSSEQPDQLALPRLWLYHAETEAYPRICRQTALNSFPLTCYAVNQKGAVLAIPFLLFARVWFIYKPVFSVRVSCFRFVICYNSFRFTAVLKGFPNRGFY